MIERESGSGFNPFASGPLYFRRGEIDALRPR
jgi:hypothetical protein